MEIWQQWHNPWEPVRREHSLLRHSLFHLASAHGANWRYHSSLSACFRLMNMASQLGSRTGRVDWNHPSRKHTALAVPTSVVDL